MNNYLHILDGRIRIKIPQVKGRPRTAAELERLLRAQDGVTEVSANTTTGNALILFDSTILSEGHILDILAINGYYQKNGHSTGHASRGSELVNLFVIQAADSFGKHLAETAVQVTVKSLILALV